MPTYKKNFLDRVIFRIDFEKINLGSVKEYTSEISRFFGAPQSKQGESGMIQLDLNTKKIEHASDSFTSWVFKTKSEDALLEVGNSYLFIEYTKYKSSKELLEHVKEVVVPFINRFDITYLRRIGLRYINKIEFKDKDYLDWNKYINKEILGYLSFAKDNKYALARAMGQLAIREDDFNILFNFGILNQQKYPNIISDKAFLLDYDCHSIFPTDISEQELLDIVNKYSDATKSVFESSITSGYRSLIK
ncbi:MAG: TIGR04255 family protein [Patescibacteria group bacterium]|nr:TIGR04255 family protein [Patescibacteria group bacterium]